MKIDVVMAQVKLNILSLLSSDIFKDKGNESQECKEAKFSLSIIS